MVEQLTLNQRVLGSSPSASTKLYNGSAAMRSRYALSLRRLALLGKRRSQMDIEMAAFKSPDFNERAAAARDAKARALEQLRNKAAPDPEVVAARQAASQAREAREAERRAARKAAIEQEKAAKEEARAKALAEAQAAAEAAAAAKRPPHVPTAAELKAARDARYAARKARQR